MALFSRWSFGSGSLEQDGSIAVVAMEEKKQTRLMHHYRLGKRERHADKTSETLAQRSIPALHMGGLSCLFSHSARAAPSGSLLNMTPRSR